MSATDWTAKKAALEEALTSGELTVESDGDRVTYRSFNEIRAAIDYCNSQIAATQTTSLRPASTIASYCTR